MLMINDTICCRQEGVASREDVNAFLKK
ncbi:MAG: hypothetical protein HRF42_15275 [Candidatus Brocadia sp.]